MSKIMDKALYLIKFIHQKKAEKKNILILQNSPFRKTNERKTAYELLNTSKYFDKKWYLKTYPDVAKAGIDPIKHYLKYGWKEGRNPGRLFDGNMYLSLYDDVKRADINPLVHYLRFGMKEKRKIHRVFENKKGFVQVYEKILLKLPFYKTNEKQTDYELLNTSKYFDKKWYLKTYPDVAKAGIDPIKHYLKYGWKEGRNPGRLFDGNMYLSLYDDVKNSNMNPLVHYLRFGMKEKRLLRLLRKENSLVSLFKKPVFLKRCNQITKQKNDFKNIIKLKVCYITYTRRVVDLIKDPSVRYRCYNPSEALSEIAAVATVCDLKTFLKFPSYHYDIYVFHRPCSMNGKFKKIFQQLKKRHKILIADYDDLIFSKNVQTVQQAPIKLCEGQTLAQTRQIMNDFTETLKLFDNFSVTTAALQNAVLEIKPKANVSIVHNFIPESVLSFIKQQNLQNAPKDKNLIMYCSGGKTHNEDLQSVTPALIQTLDAHPELKLMIVGTIDVPNELERHKQYVYTERCLYLYLLKVMSTAALQIAPLIDTPTTRCKSNIKFLESALTGCALITSDCADTVADAQKGAHIGVAHCQEDWYQFIHNRAKLIDSKTRQKNIKYVEKHYTKNVFLKEFNQLLAHYRR